MYALVRLHLRMHSMTHDSRNLWTGALQEGCWRSQMAQLRSSIMTWEWQWL
jgi:hypothetical protein